MDLPQLRDLQGEEEIVLITHDEGTFYSKEGSKTFSMENGKKKLPPKSKGTSIMVSGFLCACHSFMSVESDEVLCKFYQLFEAGKARDGKIQKLPSSISTFSPVQRQ